MSGRAVPITELATLARSKNAGPFAISLDLVFPDRATWLLVRDAHVFTRARVAELYRLPLERVSDVIEYPAANALKINLYRERPAGSVGERDTYGSQQHPPLDGLLVEVKERPA